MGLSICIPSLHGRSAQLINTLCNIWSLGLTSVNYEIVLSLNSYSDSEYLSISRYFCDKTKAIRGESLSMNENFLNCLNVATHEYILFLGDDDFLLPSVVEAMALIENTRLTIPLCWYRWPYYWSSSVFSGRLFSVPRTNSFVNISSADVRAALKSFLIDYQILPSIYNSIYPLSLLEEYTEYLPTHIQYKSKVSPIPRKYCLSIDIFTAYQAIGGNKNYILSCSPITLSGISNSSGGMAPLTRPAGYWKNMIPFEPLKYDHHFLTILSDLVCSQIFSDSRYHLSEECINRLLVWQSYKTCPDCFTSQKGLYEFFGPDLAKRLILELAKHPISNLGYFNLPLQLLAIKPDLQPQEKVAIERCFTPKVISDGHPLFLKPIDVSRRYFSISH